MLISKVLQAIQCIKDYRSLQAYTRAGQYLIENFVIHGLVGAVALPMTILNISGVIDNTWAIVRCQLWIS